MDKRKNDDPPRRFPWYAVFFIVIGFALGVVVTLLFAPGSSGTSGAVMVMSGDDFARSEISNVQPVPAEFITATFYIEQATQMAAGIFPTPLPVQGDALLMTATQIIREATQTVEAAHTATAGS